MIDHEAAKVCADRLQAFAEPSRMRIIECLLTGSKNVSELAKMLQLEIVNVSHHLSVLRQAQLVIDEKHGRFVIYSLNNKIFNEQTNRAILDLGWCKVEIQNA